MSTVLLAGIIIPKAAFAINIDDRACLYHEASGEHEVRVDVLLIDVDSDREPKRISVDVSIETDEGSDVVQVDGDCFEVDGDNICRAIGEELLGKPSEYTLSIYDRNGSTLITAPQQECEAG